MGPSESCFIQHGAWSAEEQAALSGSTTGGRERERKRTREREDEGDTKRRVWGKKGRGATEDIQGKEVRGLGGWGGGGEKAGKVWRCVCGVGGEGRG